jgi:amidase
MISNVCSISNWGMPPYGGARHAGVARPEACAKLPRVSTFIQRLEPAAQADLRVAVKDLIDLAGLPTTNGSKVIAATALPADADASCLTGTRKAEAEGRVAIVGKTNLHELAFGVTGINPWFGTPVNPIDGRLVPGGSSSGSAVAVAVGDADIAFGSDTGGSIRIPAACCGVVGLKTTRGRIPLDGVLPLAPSLDTVGPMAASVALLAEGMALLEPGFRASAGPALRVARVRRPAIEQFDAAIDSALSGARLDVEDIELRHWDEATSATMTILAAEAWGVHAGLWKEHAAELSPDVSMRLELSSLISAEEVAASWEKARDFAVELGAVFHAFDLIALPTAAEAPPTIEDAARLTEIRYVAPFNVVGLPALSMPVATSGPFPASLQLVGPARTEELIVATASVIEAAAGWKLRG